MGWSISYKADKDITENDIQDVLDEMGKTVPGVMNCYPWKYSKQSWGWSCGVDVQLPTGDEMYISGAYFSWDIAREFSKHFVKGLRKRGYKIRTTTSR